jgi:hypothetical protein
MRQGIIVQTINNIQEEETETDKRTTAMIRNATVTITRKFIQSKQIHVLTDLRRMIAT